MYLISTKLLALRAHPTNGGDRPRGTPFGTGVVAASRLLIDSRPVVALLLDAETRKLYGVHAVVVGSRWAVSKIGMGGIWGLDIVGMQ